MAWRVVVRCTCLAILLVPVLGKPPGIPVSKHSEKVADEAIKSTLRGASKKDAAFEEEGQADNVSKAEHISKEGNASNNGLSIFQSNISMQNQSGVSPRDVSVQDVNGSLMEVNEISLYRRTPGGLSRPMHWLLLLGTCSAATVFCNFLCSRPGIFKPGWHPCWLQKWRCRNNPQAEEQLLVSQLSTYTASTFRISG